MTAKHSYADCPSCGFPVSGHLGQSVSCPSCGISGSISGIEIPTPVFVGVIAFALGMFLGPAIVASTTEGQRWLERQIRRG